MELSDALDYVRERRQGVLTTLKRDGRPQLSNIAFYVGDDGNVHISVTADRAKTRNLERDPRASLYVTSDDFWSYCVVEGDVRCRRSPPIRTTRPWTRWSSTTAPSRANTPTGTSTASAMVDDGRLVLTLTPTHAYGMLGR